MPRKRQPPRLYFREDEGTWIIRDGAKSVRTGCGASDSRGAEEALSKYLAEKFKPAVRENRPAQLTVDEVLTAYGREYGRTAADPDRIGYAISALLSWWSGKSLTAVRGSSCREYTEFRTNTARSNMEHAKTDAKRTRTVSIGTVRRELGVLSAAINYWHKEHGPLDSVPVVTRPQPPEPKADVIRNRSEMARLLAGALGWYELRWTDLQTRKEQRQWRRDRYAINRHTARFIIIGRYTANRPGATLKLHWMANTVGGWPDLDREIMFRKSADRAETKKRQPSVRMGRALLAHMRRWRAIDERARKEEAERTGEPSTNYMTVVHWNGKSIKDIGKSFVTALDYAGLPLTFTPHILRHTRVTWWVEAGLPIEEVADVAGMTTEMVEKVYWHRSPHFQKRAAEA